MSMYYTKEHEWIKVKGEEGFFGITEYAVSQLGDITFVELPELELEFNQNEVICSIESVKAASDIYAPVSGKILKVNEELENTPELINESPEEDAWIAKIGLTDDIELKDLLSKEDYDAYIKDLS